MTGVDRLIDDLREREAFPEQDGDLAFEAPWQARAFAVVVSLYRDGVFEWNEFQARLIEEVQSGPAAGPEGEDAYYRHWIAAAETLLREKDVVTAEELRRRSGEFASGERDASEFVVGVEHAHAHTHGHDHER